MSIIEALWKKSSIKSMVFPGKRHTRASLKLLEWLHRNNNNRGLNELPKTITSLDERLFHNLVRLEKGPQYIIANPSEQIKHMLVLGEKRTNIKVIWLPPRGAHELVNLAEYIFLAKQSNLKVTICIPTEYQDIIKEQLKKYGASENDYELVDPKQITKEHFRKIPKINSSGERITVAQAILKLSEKS